MEEHWSGEADGIYTVEHTAVAAYHVAPVFNAVVAFDGGHHQPAEETHQADDKTDSGGLSVAKRRHRRQQRSERGGRQNAADRAGYGFRRRKRRHDFGTADQFAPNVLQHVRSLHHENQEHQQQDIAAAVEIVQVQEHQGGNV